MDVLLDPTVYNKAPGLDSVTADELEEALRFVQAWMKFDEEAGSAMGLKIPEALLSWDDLSSTAKIACVASTVRILRLDRARLLSPIENEVLKDG